MNKAVFIDRDGTLNQMIINNDHGYVDSPFNFGDFVLLKEATEFVATVIKKKYIPIIVSNQPSVAKGTLKKSELDKMTDLMCKELIINNNQVYYCFHKSEDNCDCRKPKIGLFKQAAKEHNIDLRESIVVGDGWNDVAAGKSINAKKTILIGRKDRTELINLLVENNALPDEFAKDLKEAIQIFNKIVKV